MNAAVLAALSATSAMSGLTLGVCMRLAGALKATDCFDGFCPHRFFAARSSFRQGKGISCCGRRFTVTRDWMVTDGSDRHHRGGGPEHTFGEVEAVRGISFAVKKGEIFSFLGPNGAGKSTTINILITLLPLQKGRVRVAGHDVARDPRKVREVIGIVFQDEVLDRDLTVWETMEFHGRIYGIPRDERRRRIDDLLAVVELDARRDERTKNLSGGMKRRLQIARGLLTRPEVLFLDEPTLGLDPQTRMRVWDYIRQVNEAGTTIFMTTHYMEEADMLSDRISIIDHGRIVVSGTPDELKNTLGEDVVYLETDDDERAREVLLGVEDVRSVTRSPRGLSVTISADGSHCLPRIIDRVRGAGIGIVSVNLKKPTMDDVFVHYTGRELRDGGG